MAGIVSREAVREAQREAREAQEAQREENDSDDLTDDERETLDLLGACAEGDDGLEAAPWLVDGQRRVVLCCVCEDDDGEPVLEPVAVLLTGKETLVPPEGIEDRG
jgi:hypothetical protein